MSGPLSVTLNMSHAAEMVIALFVGAGFGFVLERAGFGRADNLTAIFYGRDFRVLRVMFTAIVTGMLGLYFLDLLGVMPLSSIGILPTFLLPQLVGGLLLGAGFIVGGYCPGTSLVAAVSGKLDAVVFLVGIFLGSTVFSVSYDWVSAFHSSTSLGRVLLHEALHLPSGLMVPLVAVFAAVAFLATSRIERWVNRAREGRP
jgi:uncharacterized protein